MADPLIRQFRVVPDILRESYPIGFRQDLPEDSRLN
jgi:hypothetical protein